MYALLLTTLMGQVTDADILREQAMACYVGKVDGQFVSIQFAHRKLLQYPAVGIGAWKDDPREPNFRSWTGMYTVRTSAVPKPDAKLDAVVACILKKGKMGIGADSREIPIRPGQFIYVMISEPKYHQGKLLSFEARFVSSLRADGPPSGPATMSHFPVSRQRSLAPNGTALQRLSRSGWGFFDVSDNKKGE